MDDAGNIREDVKAPEGEIMDKITKLQDEDKNIGEYLPHTQGQ